MKAVLSRCRCRECGHTTYDYVHPQVREHESDCLDCGTITTHYA